LFTALARCFTKDEREKRKKKMHEAADRARESRNEKGKDAGVKNVSRARWRAKREIERKRKREKEKERERERERKRKREKEREREKKERTRGFYRGRPTAIFLITSFGAKMCFTFTIYRFS